jgi:hypothetical protein
MGNNIKQDNKNEKHYTGKILLNAMNNMVQKYSPLPTEFLENSAGSGNMIVFLKEKYPTVPIIAFDIHNETLRPDIKESDYLKEKIEYKEGRVAFINPPFQKGLKFVYKALEESDVCYFILSANSLINIDYEKYFLLECELYKMFDFGTCKVNIIVGAIRKKREGDKYE